MPAIDEIPLTEKYRPETLDDVIGNKTSVERMKDFVSDDSVPHLLLQGPAGTGKTASVVAFAKDKYGDDWKSNLIQMNASDDRGIDVVREDIKRHAQQSPAGRYSYKIIHLDESDALTDSAMNALRRIMEKYSDQTRFFLSCNWASRLIDPIQSRCIPLPFNRLNDSEIKEILYNIIEQEGVEYEKEAVEQIVDFVHGDARRAVNSLQFSIEDGEVTGETIELVNLQADPEEIEEMIYLAVNGQTAKAMHKNDKDIEPQVTDHSQFCRDLMNVVQQNDDIHDDVRWFIMSQIGELERNILEGASPAVQTKAFLAKLPVAQNSSIPNYD